MASIESTVNSYNKSDMSVGELVKWAVMNDLRKYSIPVGELFERVLRPVSIGEADLRENYPIDYYDVDEEIVIDPPDGLNTARQAYSEHRSRVGRYTLSRPFVAEIPNVTLVGDPPFAISESNELVVPAAVKPQIVVVNLLENVKSVLSISTSLKRWNSDSLESGILLFNGWSSNYCHWMFDDLLRLKVLQENQLLEDEGVNIIIPENPADWQLEWLELLGIPDDLLVRWQYDALHVENLLVTNRRRNTVTSESGMRWLREAALDSAPENDDYPDKIFISREDTSRRRILNRDEVLDVLQERGFERYVPSELSVREQAAVFDSADRIVSPFGANLSNVIFSSDADLVCLNSSAVYDALFFELATHVDTRFHTMDCETYGSDIQVDISELVRLLDTLGARSVTRA